MINDLKTWIETLIDENKLYKFYKSKYWIKLKNEVLEEQHYECQICLKKGKLTKADTVHHIRYVKEWPELALSKYFINEHKYKQKNLIAICFDCHNKVHNRFNFKEPINDEKW